MQDISSRIESLSKFFAFGTPLFLGAVYLFSLGYIESLGIPEYPTFFETVTFYIYATVTRLSTIAVKDMCLLFVIGAISSMVVYFFKRKSDFKLPEDRMDYYNRTSTEIISSKVELKEKIEIKSKLIDLRDAEIKKFKNYKLAQYTLISFLTPAAFLVTWKLFALLAIFIPFIISGLMYWVNFSRHDSLWKKGILDYTVLFFSILVAIYCWTVPYAAGYNLAVYNLANNSENIPSYYVDPKSYGSLIWISEASKYFIICEQDQPRIYQVNGKDKNFIRNGDYNLKNSFCSR